jgi:outer membrane protein assembly factor BamE (lipoprotein component of BamABCDE complex)
MRPRHLLLVCVLAAPSGCVVMRQGKKFDPDIVQQFESDRTTKAEVLTKLGTPYMRTIAPGGSETWTYLYVEARAAINPVSLIVPFYSEVNSQSKSQTLTLMFDGDVLSETTIIGSFVSGAVDGQRVNSGDDERENDF